jgi:hypothetical protein
MNGSLPNAFRRNHANITRLRKRRASRVRAPTKYGHACSLHSIAVDAGDRRTGVSSNCAKHLSLISFRKAMIVTGGSAAWLGAGVACLRALR